eukprot:3386583-Rhodomonas_salina.1
MPGRAGGRGVASSLERSERHVRRGRMPVAPYASSADSYVSTGHCQGTSKSESTDQYRVPVVAWKARRQIAMSVLYTVYCSTHYVSTGHCIGGALADSVADRGGGGASHAARPHDM